MKQESISVATLGLDERSRHILANNLTRISNGICQLGDIQQAQVALLDLDTGGAERLFYDFRQTYPGIVIIGIGMQQPELPVHAFVLKPLNQDQLLVTIVNLVNPGLQQTKNMITDDKIAKAMQALESQKVGKSLHKRAEDIQAQAAAKPASTGKAEQMHFNPNRLPAMAGKSEQIYFDPMRFLLGHVLAAVTQIKASNQAAVLTCWNNRMIVINPWTDKISSNLSDSQIRSLAISPIDDSGASQIRAKYYSSDEEHGELIAVLASKDLRHFSQESFLWDLGLLTCRGRIPTEFSVSNRHYLRRWPNLTRSRIPANALPILAYWNKQPSSLLDIKEQLCLPQEDVFAVFSAAYAAGLTGEAKRKSDQIMQVIELNEHKKRGVMKSIISRLRGDKSKKRAS